MARITTPLTAKAITHLRPLSVKEFKESKAKSKTTRLYDGAGLFIEAPVNGSKRWRLKYRFEGKEKLISLGTYPTVTLKDARDARDKMKTMISNGIDPALERKERKVDAKLVEIENKSLFFKIASQWIDEEIDPILQYINKLKRVSNRKIKIDEDIIRKKIAEGKIRLRRVPSESTMKRHNSILDNDVIPIIGQMPIDTIQADDIRNILVNIMGRGAIETSHRALSLIKRIWEFAISTGFTTRNTPADIIAKSELVEFHHNQFRTITDPKMIGELMRAIDNYQGDATTTLGMRLLSLTAARPGNIRFAEWSEFDMKKKLWSIPASKMKMREAHIIPLSEQVVTLLEEIHPLTGDYQYVFKSSVDGSPFSENTLNNALKRLDFGDKIVSHGFRAMFSTISNNSGKFNRDIIEKSLAHKLGDTIEQVYNRAEYISQRRELMQWWADFLDIQKDADSK